VRKCTQNVTQDGILVMVDSLDSIKSREFIEFFLLKKDPAQLTVFLLLLVFQVHHIFLHQKIS